jgi:hypothetical protein
MQSVYELKRIKSSSDKSLGKALNIYSQNIDPLIRTDTREILYWLDNYNTWFNDRFYLVALYLNDKVIGYGQFVYFQEEKIVFIDYLAIEKNSRKNNTFYEFIEKIKDFFIEEHIEYNYIVTEVGYYKQTKEPTEVAKNLIRLLKMTGFGVIKMPYFQPMLGKMNYETEVGAVLMIYTSNDLKTLKMKTFLLLIDTIYYKHYKRWYDKFLDEKSHAEYVSRLRELKQKIELSARKKLEVEINGYANLFPTSQSITSSSNYVRTAKVLGVFIVFILLSIGIGSIVLFLKKKYELDADAIKFIALCSLVIIFLLSTIFYKSKNEFLSGVIERFLKLFN